MKPELQSTINELVGDLRPTAPFRRWRGLTLLGLAAVATLILVAVTMGLRPDIAAGRVTPLFLLANGLWLVLAASAGSTVIAMASPQVGSNHEGWRWTTAMAALLPASVMILLLTANLERPAQWMSASDRSCLLHGLGFAAIAAVAMLTWLRRGAPAAPARAALVAGIAAGSIGILAFAFHCPSDDLYHIGVWHAAPIAVGAVVGRLVFPHLFRW